MPSKIRGYHAVAPGEEGDLLFPVPCAGAKSVDEEHWVAVTHALVEKADVAYLNVGHDSHIAF